MANLLDRAETARKYYDSITNNTVVSGLTMYILTDGNRCLVVENPYTSSDVGTVFRVYRRNGETVVEATN